jgi:hypothetical protein
MQTDEAAEGLRIALARIAQEAEERSGFLDLLSFPRSAWECIRWRSAPRFSPFVGVTGGCGTRSVRGGIPTRSVGTMAGRGNETGA